MTISPSRTVRLHAICVCCWALIHNNNNFPFLCDVYTFSSQRGRATSFNFMRFSNVRRVISRKWLKSRKTNTQCDMIRHGSDGNVINTFTIVQKMIFFYPRTTTLALREREKNQLFIYLSFIILFQHLSRVQYLED